MSEIKLQITYSDSWKRTVRNLLTFGRAKIRRIIRTVLAEVGRGVVEEIKTVGFSGRPYLINRTGRLRQSFRHRIISANRERAQIAVFSVSPYARAHTTSPGLTIFPRQAKILALPKESVLGAKGEKLYPSPLGTSTFKVVKRGSQGFLAFRDGPRKNEISHFFRSSVFIPQRLPLGEFVNSYMRKKGIGFIQKEFSKAIVQVS